MTDLQKQQRVHSDCLGYFCLTSVLDVGMHKTYLLRVAEEIDKQQNAISNQSGTFTVSNGITVHNMIEVT